MNKGIEQMERALAREATQSPAPLVESAEIKGGLRSLLDNIGEGYNAQAMANAVKTIISPPQQSPPPAKDPVDTLIGLQKAGFVKPQGDEIGTGVATIIKEVISERGRDASEARAEAKNATDRFMALAMELLKEGNGREIRALAEKLERLGTGSKSVVEQALEEVVAKALVENIGPMFQPRQAQQQPGLSGITAQLKDLVGLRDFFKEFFEGWDRDPLMKLPAHLQNPLLNADMVRAALDADLGRARLAQEERKIDKDRAMRERVMTTAEKIASQIAPALTVIAQRLLAGTNAVPQAGDQPVVVTPAPVAAPTGLGLEI